MKFTKNDLKMINPIFKKVVQFGFTIENVDDKDLSEFLLQNKNLEYLRIGVRCSKLRGTFLSSIPRKTAVHLKLDDCDDESADFEKNFDINFIFFVPSLKSLSFCEINITNEKLIDIGRECLDLETVKIKGMN